MPEETAVAEAAPSTPQPEAPLEIPRSNSAEYTEWRTSGKLPEKNTEPDKAASATAKEGKTDDSADSAANDTQEKRQSKRDAEVEGRIKTLTDKLKAVTSELEESRKPKTEKAESSTAKPAQPQTYAEWRKEFKPSDWVAEYGKANPDATYEDANAALADHLGDVREQFKTVEQQRQQQAKELNSKVESARARYGDRFDEVVQPTANEIWNDAEVNVNVKTMFIESDVLPDLMFTIGSDPAYLAEFLKLAKNSPGKALRKIAVLENGIIEQLAKGTENTDEARNEKGQFAKSEETPAKRTPAPPPLEIGSRGTGTMDESERALQAIERGDPKAVRAFMDAENKKDLARRRGV